jgi:transposase
VSDNNRTPSGGYRQRWTEYRVARRRERELFPALLRELCNEVEEPEYAVGCPPLPLRDRLFCIAAKVYSRLPSDKVIHDLERLHSQGCISDVPAANTLSEYMRDESHAPHLYHLLSKSSLPLAEVEDIFAVDSTGLSAPRRRLHFNRHKKRHEKRRDYVKLHIMCGVRTNIITSAIVTPGAESDRSYFKPLVENTAQYFDISEVSADAGYMSASNSRTVLLLGGKPYIAFNKNCVLDADYKSQMWKDTLALWKQHHPDFMRHYYLRNNVEATFSALKRTLGGELRSKSDSGLVNEALCKAIRYNICVLIQEMYVLGIDPISWREARLRPRAAAAGTLGRALTERESELVSERIGGATRAMLVGPQLPKDTDGIDSGGGSLIQLPLFG